MKAQISFDLVMRDPMSFVEGTYRLLGKQWQVFVFGPDASVSQPEALSGKWESGVSGIFIKWPEGRRLNKDVVLETLSRELGVTEWEEVPGPDSMQLR